MAVTLPLRQNISNEYDTKFLSFDKETYENWINDIYKKVVCAAKNKNDLLKLVDIAEQLGLKKDEDFWIIKDCCLTELEPEELDEVGRNCVPVTTTCIGKTVKEVEDHIVDLVPDEFLLQAHHLLLLHGRYTCTAKNPKCDTCHIASLCKKNIL